MNQNFIIINNFFKKKDFLFLNTIKLNKVSDSGIEVNHNIVNKNGKIIKSNLNETTLKKFHKSYHKKALNILKKLAPQKIKLYDYSDFSIVKTGKFYKFPIHDDTPNKLLSGVIYLKPLKNKGTLFYLNKKGKGKKEIPWKRNRAVFFSRIENKTWHSFEADKISERVVVVFNLCTNDLKKVLTIESKNYFKSFFRYKINPYLYKIFGKII